MTPEYCAQVLSERAARYGGTLGDMLSNTPTQLLDNPDELMAYWDSKDLSHIKPQSQYPELADDWSNIIAEDSTINRQRGARTMTEEEVSAALFDNEMDADIYDSMFGGDDPEFTEALLDLVPI